MIEPEPSAPPPREAAGDRQTDVRQHCGPYRLDFYATPDAVVCVISDEVVADDFGTDDFGTDELMAS